VVNGTRELVGSDDRGARSAIESAGRETAVTVRVGNLVRSGGFIDGNVSLSGSGKMPGPQSVNVALTQSGLSTEVARGENSGRSLRNDFVVRSLSRAAALPDGTSIVPLHIPLESSLSKVPLRIVVFVQDDRTMAVRGAGFAALPR
jgi:hypothetical protein